MKFADFSVRNSLLVNLISVFIIVFGLVAMMGLKRTAFPSVSFDEVMITSLYPGAPAEDIEKLITNPIEKEVRGVSGVREITSKSEESLSNINVVIEPGVLDKKKVVDDIRRAVDRVRGLPAEMEEDPLVTEMSSDEFPVFQIALGGDFEEYELRRWAERLEDNLLDIRGVSTVARYGWRDPEFWVEVDPDRLVERYVSINEIIRALAARNVTLPAGLMRMDEFEYNIRTTGEFETAEEIMDVIIRANDAGNWLRVRDVARVRPAFQDEAEIMKTNSKRTLTMVVIKTKEADIIRLVDKVKKELAVFEQTMPEGMEITISEDYSYYVQRRLNVLRNNGIIGLLLVMLVLFVFLDPIPAVTTALGIPMALFSTFAVMYIFDISVNLVSMLGLIIVLGMLVDDGIIVSENVFRYVEQGMQPKEAAVKGTNEVVAPVIATILTTGAAFAPLLFMKDIMGKFIREIPLVVMIALSASLIQAFIILPSHLSDLMHAYNGQGGRKRKEPRKWFQNLQAFYKRVLMICLDHRYKFFAGLMVVFIGTILLARVTMQYVGFKDDGIEQFYIKAEAPKGTSLYRTNELSVRLEEIVAALPVDELDAYQTLVGASQEDRAFDPSAKKASNLVTITAHLTPAQGRKRGVHAIADEIREKLKEVQGFEQISVDLPQAGPPTGRAIEVGVKGESFERLNAIAAEILAFLQTVPGVSDLSTSYQDGKKQMMVVVDYDKAKQRYVDVQRIASAVRFAFDGGVATAVKPKTADEQINVLVRFDADRRQDKAAFEKILIENSPGNLIPLSAVATIEEVDGLYSVQHLDGKRVVYVTGNVDLKNATSLSVNRLLEQKFGQLSGPDDFGYALAYGGEFEGQMESIKNLQISFGAAFFIIFIILTAMFNSLVQPFIVMLAIPFGLIGVVIAFFFHGEPLSFFSVMGLVGLTGIVVNNSVVLVDFINKLRKEGHERRESLITAGLLRLRPVLMTTITTVGGLVSVAYGIGGSDPFLKPMGLALVWGLTFSTVLTLIFIPCVYAIIDDLVLLVMRRPSVKNIE